MIDRGNLLTANYEKVSMWVSEWVIPKDKEHVIVIVYLRVRLAQNYNGKNVNNQLSSCYCYSSIEYIFPFDNPILIVYYIVCLQSRIISQQGTFSNRLSYYR